VLVEGSNYLTEARLNGTGLGRHEGGYTPFPFTRSSDVFSSVGIVGAADPSVSGP
jgi:hypothetical protein